MAEKQIEKHGKVEDDKGVPPAAGPARVWDARLYPGESPKASQLHVSVNAVDKDATWIDDTEVPGVKSTSGSAYAASGYGETAGTHGRRRAIIRAYVLTR